MSGQKRLALPDIERTNWNDESIGLRNSIPLPEPLQDVLARFDYWVEQDGGAPFICDDESSEGALLSYGEIDLASDAVAHFLQSRGVQKGRSVAVLGSAGTAHAALKLACLKIGAVHAPLSPALLASAFGRTRLSQLLAVAKPQALIDLTGDNQRFLSDLPSSSPPVIANSEIDAVCRQGVNGGKPDRIEASPDDPTAIYFTSGSTGEPKGVVITRQMIASNQSAYALHWPFLAQARPVLIDWLPWHHVFGGLDNFFKMLWNGGAYYVAQPPDPTRIEALARQIRKVKPTIHINVPFGLSLLMEHLASDRETAAAFFERLELIFFAGAGMNAQTWEELQRFVAAGPHGPGGPPTVLSGYGATEAGSTICLGYQAAQNTNEIGVPLPGHALRLAPVGDAWEVRVQGPNVSPGYVSDDGLAPLPLDDEGYLCTGDLVVATFEATPERGLSFDGRIAEDFKLATGTRVKVGSLRHALLEACAPHLQDVAIAGAGQSQLAVILYPTATAHEQFGAVELASFFAEALAQHNVRMPGSSTAVHRAAVASNPPDRGAGEINDKGHLVQNRCLANNAKLVTQLYDVVPAAGIITVSSPTNEQDDRRQL